MEERAKYVRLHNDVSFSKEFGHTFIGGEDCFHGCSRYDRYIRDFFIEQYPHYFVSCLYLIKSQLIIRSTGRLSRVDPGAYL